MCPYALDAPPFTLSLSYSRSLELRPSTPSGLTREDIELRGKIGPLPCKLSSSRATRPSSVVAAAPADDRGTRGE